MTTAHHRKLLILDLDETLIHAREQRDGIRSAPDFSVFDYHVWKRPFLADFIVQVQQWFDLAVWTASSPTYAQAVIPYLFPEPNLLLFVWARNRCTQRINREYNIFYWRKNLNKVKRQMKRRLEHVIMIDDSPEKLERHYGNLITVIPFEGQPEDTELRDLLPYLSWLQTVENVRSVEKRYWRSFQLPAEDEAGEIAP